MLIVKAFGKGYRCLGYQYKGIGELNVTEKAQAVSCGFHGAEDPMDCVWHYRGKKDTVYCLCEAGGDIDEDERDSKVVCTELTILREISIRELVQMAMLYMIKYPNRKISGAVDRESGIARSGLAVVRGRAPQAKGEKGDVLGLCKEDSEGNITDIAILTVDGEKIRENTYYKIGKNGEVE